MFCKGLEKPEKNHSNTILRQVQHTSTNISAAYSHTHTTSHKNNMIIAGIDPGWRNFSVHIATVENGIWTWIYWESVDILRGRKNYSLCEFKRCLKQWYDELGPALLQLADHVVVEKQPYLRFQNIVDAFRELVPRAIVLDVRGMKKQYGISTGSHYSNKKAVVEKFSHILPRNGTFKENHNLLDSWLIAHHYATDVLHITIKSNR